MALNHSSIDASLSASTASRPWSLDRSLGVSTDGKLASFLFYDSQNEWHNIVVLFNARLDDTASRGILAANTTDVVEACMRAADLANGQPQHRYCNVNIAGIVCAIHFCETFLALRFESRNDAGGSDMTYGVNVIMQADAAEIEKWTVQAQVEHRETSAMYRAVTRGIAESRQPKNDWVQKILNGEREGDKVLAQNEDWMLVYDAKWREQDHGNASKMHCLALAKQSGLWSVRDLRGEHLPMLCALQKMIASTVERVFALHPTQYRVYFHYWPNFWWLHVHVVALTAPSFTGGGVLLDDAMQWLEMDAGYFAKAALTVRVSEGCDEDVGLAAVVADAV